MTQQLINILEIIGGVLGIIFILAQNRSEQGSSFFGGSGDVFKLRKGADRVFFFLTFVIIAVLLVLIYIDIKIV